MTIQFLKDWRNFAKGEIVKTIPQGSAVMLIQRGIAKQYEPPAPNPVTEVVRKVVTYAKRKQANA